VSVLTHQADDSWAVKKFKAHKTGCNAVSWAPVFDQAAGEAKRLVTGGCDNRVKLWRCGDDGEWVEEVPQLPPAHQDWVRDVAWAPSLGLAPLIASCSQDKKVIVWTQDVAGSTWSQKEIQFSCVVWRVSWSVTGNVLAVSGGDSQVSLWKENLMGDWEQIGQLSEDGATTRG